MVQKHQNTQIVQEMTVSNISRDVQASVLIVSLVANLAVFTLWLTVQMTSQYDTALVRFFLGT